MLQHLGDIQSDGMIHLKDPNLIFREDIEPKRRFRQSARQKAYLGKLGYTSVNSSNVSALMVRDNDLYVRFLNGSVYVYPGSAKLFDKIMNANSKGRAVWNYLRRARVPYGKIASIPLPEDRDVSDDELFVEPLLEMAKNSKVALINPDTILINGNEVVEFKIDGVVLFIPLLALQSNTTDLNLRRSKNGRRNKKGSRGRTTRGNRNDN